MRITKVLNDVRPGGIEVLVPRIIEQLTDYAPQVFVLHSTDVVEEDVFSSAGIPYAKGARRSISNYTLYLRYLLKHKPSAVHIYNCSPLTIILSSVAGIRHILYSIHGERFGRGKFKKLYAKVLWKVALICKPELIANSKYTAEAFWSRISPSPGIRVIYNPLHISVPELSYARKEDKFEVIYCGRLSESKNLYLWLDAAKAISGQKPNAIFRLYGEGMIKEDLTSYAEKLGIADKTEFMGHVRDIGKAYLSADLLLFLSKYESFGNVVVESIACGVPVLCSDIPSLKEIFADYPEFVVSLKDGLIPDILSRLENYSLLKEKALQARDQFIEKFSLAEHVRQLREVYDAFQAFPDHSRGQEN